MAASNDSIVMIVASLEGEVLDIEIDIFGRDLKLLKNTFFGGNKERSVPCLRVDC